MIKELNRKYEQRVFAVQERIAEIYIAENNGSDQVADYFSKNAAFIGDMFNLEFDLSHDYFVKHTFEELLEMNHKYYEDIVGEAYNTSYVNPDVAVKAFGERVGKVLSLVAFRIRSFVGYAFEHSLSSMMWSAETFIKVYEVLDANRESFMDDQKVYDALINILREDSKVDLDDKLRLNFHRRFNPDFRPYSSIAEQYEESKDIFRYGMYIGHNEMELVKYFRSAPKEQLQKMADTYTEAYIRGFERNNVDLESKKATTVGYHIGFEPVIKLANKNFEKYNLKPIVYYDLMGSPRPRIINTKPSKQMEYDHKFDSGLYYTKELSKNFNEVYEKILVENKEYVDTFAGIAMMEVFGEVPFEPSAKDTTVKYEDDAMKELMREHTSTTSGIVNKYMPRSNWSFVIISFPVPEIGGQFKEIFDATIEVNTLDERIYMDIQQSIIEALDQGEKVHITGRKGNRTDLYVALNDQVDISKETNFNNCTADVNVPVGEVFTSPKLEGTNGKLHVKEVYLHGLKYIDLDIDFKDGMMDDYTCKNFDDEEKNVAFIQENLTHPHKTLPLGEFAIGTNTTAYAMAKKFDIEKIIPILIGEKMGPHFAVGDTCYTWSEDTAVFNPDGREIVARENSLTALRKTEVKKAYTYCHTDITIPYSELNDITVIKANGETIDIIKEGRFVLKGTELLNEPLKDLEV